jgi:hypothetical protein
MALECTDEQMIEMLDEHLPYEVAMMLVCHDNLYPTARVTDDFSRNVLIESFCLHARNLFEFFTKKNGGGKNYAFAKAYAPNFEASESRKPPQTRTTSTTRFVSRSLTSASPASKARARFGPTLRCPQRLRCCCPR